MQTGQHGWCHSSLCLWGSHSIYYCASYYPLLTLSSLLPSPPVQTCLCCLRASPEAFESSTHQQLRYLYPANILLVAPGGPEAGGCPPAAGPWAWPLRHIPELSSSFRIFSFTRSSHWRRICTASSMGQWSRRILSMASSLSPGSRVPVLHGTVWMEEEKPGVDEHCPPPQPHPCPWGTPPVRHAAFLDVGDDQGLPSLSAGRCGVGRQAVNLIFMAPA